MANNSSELNSSSSIHEFDDTVDGSFAILCSSLKLPEMSSTTELNEIDEYFAKLNAARDDFDQYILGE